MSYIRIRMIPDTKNRAAGPYGPYAYLGWREGKKIREHYLGKCASISDMRKLRERYGNKRFMEVEDAVIARG